MQDNAQNFSDIDTEQLFLKELSRIRKLSPEEERTLFERYKQGDHEAGKQLVEANLPFVVEIARRYTGHGVEYLDLIQDGSMGLMRALELFDPDKGARLSTYAESRVKQSIFRAFAEKYRTIRIPDYLNDRLSTFQKMRQKLTVELGREPSEAELQAESGFTAEQIREMEQLMQEPLRLEAPTGKEEDITLGDMVPDPNASVPEEAIDRDLLREAVEKLLADLDESEKDVLRGLFGFEGGEPQTLSAVGKQMQKSGERVRQIREKAIKKLQRPSRKNQLKDFL